MIEYQRKVEEAIQSLVDENGNFNFGIYKNPIPNINMLSAKEPLGFKAAKGFNNMRLKEWEAFQLGNDNLFIFGAVYNAKISAIICLEIYDRIRKESISILRFVHPSKTRIGMGIMDSITAYETKGFTMKITNYLKKDKIRVFVNIEKTNKWPEVKLDVTGYHIAEPIVVCLPLGDNRAIYSHKSLMSMEGYLSIEDNNIEFNREDSHLIVDDHKGYYPYKLEYDWVTGWGKDDDGNIIGFNLTDNQVIDKENYNENCLWLNGKMYPLPPIKVERKYDKEEVWHIKDEYNMVDIYFCPEAKKEIKFNYLIVYSDYEAPIGSYHGYININDKIIDMKNCFGMGEKKIYRM